MQFVYDFVIRCIGYDVPRDYFLWRRIVFDYGKAIFVETIFLVVIANFVPGNGAIKLVFSVRGKKPFFPGTVKFANCSR